MQQRGVTYKFNVCICISVYGIVALKPLNWFLLVIFYLFERRLDQECWLALSMVLEIGKPFECHHIFFIKSFLKFEI